MICCDKGRKPATPRMLFVDWHLSGDMPSSLLVLPLQNTCKSLLVAEVGDNFAGVSASAVDVEVSCVTFSSRRGLLRFGESACSRVACDDVIAVGVADRLLSIVRMLLPYENRMEGKAHFDQGLAASLKRD